MQKVFFFIIFGCIASSQATQFAVDSVSAKTIYVDAANGNDNTAYVGNVRPFATLGAAWTAAEALSPSSSNQVLIVMGPGVFTQAANITTAQPYITLRGAGIDATTVQFTSSYCFTIGSANIKIRDISLERSGSNAGKVFHVSTTNLATWKDGIRLDRVSITNISGTAVGTLACEAYGCRFLGIIAVDWIYGGRCYNCEITGHDPALSAASYAVKTIQSIAIFGGYVSYNSDESYKFQRALISGGRIINTDPNGVGVNGVTEDEAGDRLTKDWYYQLQQQAPANSGQPYVSWFPPPLVGVYVLGPQPRNGYGADNQGSISRSTGTGGALRGTLRMVGGEYYGSYLMSYLHDSDTIGGMFVAETGTHQVMNQVTSCSFTGASFIFGNNRLGTSDGLVRLNLGNGMQFMNCHFQGQTCEVLRGNQSFAIGCTETGFDGVIGMFGMEDPRRHASRLDGTGNAAWRTYAVTGDYALATSTWECWFRCDNSGSDQRLLDYAETGTISTHYSSITVKPSTGQLYAYAGGVQVCNVSSLSFADSAWHHVAMVITGGTGTVYLDGASIGSAGSVSMGGTSRFDVGRAGDGGAMFKGDITEIRISNSARYSGSFTPATHFTVDANTVSLWSDSTRIPYGWTDQTGLHDLGVTGYAPGDVNARYQNPNIPYWVLRDSPLTWF